MKLVLSSTSPARRALLDRLGIAFETYSPNIDESPLPLETVQHTVARLAREKARAAIKDHPKALIIGSDQLISVQGEVLGKPHTLEKAKQQLTLCSNTVLDSYTALCVLNSKSGELQETIAPYQVKFKALSPESIERYLKKDQPFMCAGSIKAESLGPCLFEWMRGDDPNALTGLPLIQLCDMLRQEGLDVLAA